MSRLLSSLAAISLVASPALVAHPKTSPAAAPAATPSTDTDMTKAPFKMHSRRHHHHRSHKMSKKTS